MAHSCIVCEPIVHIGGFALGIITAAVTGVQSPENAVHAGVTVYVIWNLAVGIPINVLMLDIISLIFVRPFSSILGAKVLAALLTAVTVWARS